MSEPPIASRDLRSQLITSLTLPGVTNSDSMQTALETLTTVDIILPVWDVADLSGGNALSQVVDFARVRLLDYNLVGRDRFISARFLGYAVCGTSP